MRTVGGAQVVCGGYTWEYGHMWTALTVDSWISGSENDGDKSKQYLLSQIADLLIEGKTFLKNKAKERYSSIEELTRD